MYNKMMHPILFATRSLLSPIRRELHATAARESTVLVAGLTVAAGAMAARYGLQLYERNSRGDGSGDASSSSSSSSERPVSSSSSSSSTSGGSAGSTSASGGADASSASSDSASSSASGAGDAAKASTHKTFGAEMWAKRFYRGGFEDKMTRREAALILGVRESATTDRIRERHRKMLILNHPDMGGSTFL